MSRARDLAASIAQQGAHMHWMIRSCLIVALVGCNPLLTPIEVKTEALVGTASHAQILWVLDMSGSLILPADTASSACPQNCGAGTPCPLACFTRQQLIGQGLEQFAMSQAAESHIAMLFPGAVGAGTVQDQCSAPRIVQAVAANDLASFFLSRRPAGGTPTAAALTAAANLAQPDRTETIVVLVTDGFPNCNPENAHNICSSATAEEIAACRCVSASCASQLCALGCIDDLGTAAAALAFGPLGHQLMVLTVGPDFESSVAPYSDMKIDLTPLGAKTYRIKTALDFALPAARLVRVVTESQHCTWWLNREVTRETLRASVDGAQTPADQWTLRGEGTQQRVAFTGQACQLLLGGATPAFALSFAQTP